MARTIKPPMRNAATTAMSGKSDSRIRVFIVFQAKRMRPQKYHVLREGVKTEAVCSRPARPQRKKGEPLATRLFLIFLSKPFQLSCPSVACFAFESVI